MPPNIHSPVGCAVRARYDQIRGFILHNPLQCVLRRALNGPDALGNGSNPMTGEVLRDVMQTLLTLVCVCRFDISVTMTSSACCRNGNAS